MTKKGFSQEGKLILIFNREKPSDKTPHLFMIKAVIPENNFNQQKTSTKNLQLTS